MKRVIFLRSNPVNPDPRVEKEAQTLSDEEYNVTVVGWDRTGTLPKKERTAFGEIYRIGIKADFGKGVKNFFKLLRWQLALLRWLMKNDYEIIHSCDFDTVLPSIIIGKLKKVKVIYDIFDFYSDMVSNTPTLIRKTIKKIDYFVINHVDAVIIADPTRKMQIKGTRPKMLKIIYNTPRDIYYERLTTNQMFLIVYVGVLQVDRGLIEMIEVVGKHLDWKMIIAGYGADECKVESLASNYPNIYYCGRISYERSLELSSKADVLFATYDPAIPNNKYSSPNKLFEAMMLGKPIVVSDGSSMADIVRRVDNGIVVKYGNKLELEGALVKLQGDLRLRMKLGANSRLAYEREYSWNVMKSKLLQLYDKILQ